MQFKSLELEGAFLIETNRNIDKRGSFTRLFCKEEFTKYNLDSSLNQISLSHNEKKGTLRGMHYQINPFEEAKFIQCITGKVFDVIVDLKKNSSTYLKWISVELSEKDDKILYVPKGFAHGFQTLEDNSTLLYFITEKYNPTFSKGFSYKDENINIQWPIKEKIMSDKDLNLSSFESGVLL